MTGAQIAALILQFGPVALEMIEKMVANWNKEMEPDELKLFCRDNRQAYLAWREEVLNRADS